MIYLIDEQVFRQETYGWNIEKLNEYQGIISTHKDSEKLSIENIKKEKIVFLHESFPNEGLKNQLYEHNAQNRDFGLVVFSGSKNERQKNATGNRVDLPVSVFYQNLEIFLQEIKKGNKPNVNYLLYGRNLEEEKIIIDEIVKRNNEEDADTIVAKKENIIFLTAENDIENPFSNMESETLYSNTEGFSDSSLHRDVVLSFLNDKVFDNLYIPLCFGNTLSDLNGLRLAAHIRCTPTPNQLKNIFIYGVVPYEKLIQNLYFDILKTKNVFYIDYSKKTLQEAEKRETEPFLQSELANEIRKIQLVAPKDNHSIANEWAIYRWAKTIESSDKDIEKINAKIESDLYYKYLKTIYPISATDTNLHNLKIKTPENDKPKILYIDDEWEKGWYKIFETILCHNSKIEQFGYLNIDSSQNREEIVNQAVEKIKADDIDIVILDFRLHHSDFENNDLQENTSIRILQKIKKYNQGIQVVYFSATNKIWNLQKLQALGADGFIIKEAPENSIDSQFTADTIRNFKEVMETAVKRKFLKGVFENILCIKNNFKKLFSGANAINEIDSFLDIAFEFLYKTPFDKKYFNYAYLNLFLIIELFTQQDEILQQVNGNVYVGDICVKEGNDQSISFENGKYILKKSNNNKIDINFKVSSLLIYRFGFDNSSELKWTSIYTQRNKNIAHYDKTTESQINNSSIQCILNFLLYISDKQNINDKNKGKGLQINLDEKLNQLTNKYNNKV